MIAIFLPIVLILAAMYALRVWKSTKREDDTTVALKPPGPRALPIIGSSYLIDGSKSPFVSFSALADKYGDIYSLKLGSTPCVVVSSVATIRNVLMQNGKFFGGRPDFIRYHKLFAEDRQNSLALCDWCNLQIKRRNIARKHCDPRQQSPLRKTISDVASLEMRELVSTLRVKSAEAQMQGRDLKIKPILMATCLNLFSQYMCSIRFDMEHDDEFKHVVHLFDKIFWEINQGYAVDFFPWLLPFYNSHMKKLSNWSTEIRSFILSRVINTREVNLDDDEEEKDFTDALLKALKHETLFTRNAIIFTLEDFLGGSSAIGNLVMLILGLIVKNPEVGIKIQREIDEITGRQRAVTVADADLMPYTMATVRETLRYSSSPIVPHVATESATVDGYSIEKGTVILINNYKINMNEDLWENPTQFQPDRFLDRTYVEIKTERRGSDHDSGVESENESQDKKTKKYLNEPETVVESKTIKKEIVSLKNNLPHFIPFSIGKRTCLGKGLVMNFGLVMVATILQNFDLTCKQPETIKTYTACVALPPETYGLTLTPRRC